MDLNIDFPQIINDLIGERFTKTELARRCGCSRNTIYQLMDGVTQDPKYSLGAALVQLHDYHCKQGEGK